MTSRLHGIAFGLLTSLLPPAGVSQPETPTQSIDCSEGGRSQREMNICAERAATAAEARLESLLDELREKLDEARWDELQRLQGRWAQLVEEDCAWQRTFFAGGSVAPMMFSLCKQARTEERIARLKIFLCEGAGMTGPCDASRRYDLR